MVAVMWAWRAALLLVCGHCATTRQQSQGANPIRKVVTLMQNMQKEIEAEGAKEQELYDKFMCYCQGNSGDLAKSIADAKAKSAELAAKLKSEEAEKVQTAAELVGHKKDREQAQKDLAEATVIRAKEKAEYDDSVADMKTNLAAMSSAIPALEKGMGAAALLQTSSGDRLGQLVDSFPFNDENDRKNLESFLEQEGDYAPQSGQIVGILKQMKDTFEANIAEATTNEETSVGVFTELKASKEQEITVASQSIESKQVRAGELAVSVVEVKDDLEDTEKEMTDTQKFAGQLQEQCATKEKEWAERCKARSDEIAAVSEAIGILNDDDALDVFKKTKAMPASLAQQGQLGFLQRSPAHVSASHVRKAQAVLAGIATKSDHRSTLNLMLFTVSSKIKLQLKSKDGLSAGKFDEVVKLVDDMVGVEMKEQGVDDAEKPWCNGEFDKSAKEKKNEKSEIGSLEADIGELADGIASLEDEIATLTSEIAELDKAVSEATEQRKEEHEDYVESIQLSSTAMGLVDKARNRLLKFYNPVRYKAAPIKEMTMEEKVLAARGGASFAQFHEGRVAPPPPPATFGGSVKKNEKGTGVIAMMDTIVKELENDMADAEFEEKTAQEDYEELMSDSKETREKKMKSIQNKEAAKAKLSSQKLETKGKVDGDEDDVDQIENYVDDLHKKCDFILENYDVRKTARKEEMESLKNAKAMLSGAIL